MESENNILKYIHLQMNEEEKKSFEAEINANPELKAEVDFWLNMVLAEKIYGKNGFKEKLEKANLEQKKNAIGEKSKKVEQKQSWSWWLKVASVAAVFVLAMFYFLMVYLPKKEQKEMVEQILKKQSPAEFFPSSLNFLPNMQGMANLVTNTDLKQMVKSVQCDSLKMALSKEPDSQGLLFFYYTGCGYMENSDVSAEKLNLLANSENEEIRWYSRYYLALFYLIQERNEMQAFDYLRQISKQDDYPELQQAAEEVLNSLEKK